MYKNREWLQRIITKYLAGKSIKEEREFLDAYDNLFTTNNRNTDILNEDERARLEKKLEHNVLAIIESHTHKVVRLWTKIAAAAAILIFFAVGGYFVLNDRSNVPHEKVTKILPGSNRATLTLANGEKIYLAQEKNGRIAAQKGISVVKAANGHIAYIHDTNNQDIAATTSINSISTPNGGQYQVTLPDGTKVWLNAASSISFPISFTGSQNREVNLKGEAYFEVTKDKKHPFVVKTANQLVQVLGTHFNINAYGDEPGTITTLLEGAVKVSSRDGIAMATLVPNQQSALNGDNLGVKDVVAEDAIAWKEGYFRFDNEPLEEALKKIGRWYNVKIIYKDDEIKSKTTYGTMSRFSNISDVIKLLELTKAARFEISDNKIIVLKY